MKFTDWKNKLLHLAWNKWVMSLRARRYSDCDTGAAAGGAIDRERIRNMAYQAGYMEGAKFTGRETKLMQLALNTTSESEFSVAIRMLIKSIRARRGVLPKAALLLQDLSDAQIWAQGRERDRW